MLRALAVALDGQTLTPELVANLVTTYESTLPDHLAQFEHLPRPPKGSRPRPKACFTLCIIGPRVNARWHFTPGELSELIAATRQRPDHAALSKPSGDGQSRLTAIGPAWLRVTEVMLASIVLIIGAYAAILIPLNIRTYWGLVPGGLLAGLGAFHIFRRTYGGLAAGVLSAAAIMFVIAVAVGILVNIYGA